MSNNYTQVTALDRDGHRFKITCYPHVFSLLQQVEHHYKEMYKSQFCKDNNLKRLELINNINAYLTSEHFKKASSFSIPNTHLMFENKALNLSSYDHTIMDDDDVIDVYNEFDTTETYDIMFMSCILKNLINEERHYHENLKKGYVRFG